MQAVLQEFNPAAILNKEILIWYFWESLKLSIWAQLDTWGWELNSWEEAVKKAINIEIKALLQPPLGTRKIDFKSLQRYAYKKRGEGLWKK